MSEAQVYVPDADAAWARASVLSAVGGTVYEVRIDGVDDNDESGQSDWGAGEVRRVDLAGPEFGVKRKGAAVESSLPLQNLGLPDDGVEDMTRLDYLHEPAILFNLRRRFFQAMPYTYTGEIVIACNPYRAVAFAGLSKDRENQSILVSGESGAGKTETVKILMGHLAVASSAVYGDEGGGGVAAGGGEGGGGNDDVIRKIIESNPLLESFGNAQTTRNDNSSRFGKFTQLQFDGGFRMSGSGCTTYLLEKSRVVGHEPGERAYHVFYQILAAPEGAKARLGLAGKLALDFRYLTADGKEADSVIEGRTDAQRYDMTTAALGLIGVSEEETLALFRALAGVLFLGQVDFTNRGGDEDKSEVVDQEALLPPSTLLGFDGQGQEVGAAAAAVTPGAALDSSLCYRTIRARNDVLRADSSPAQAADARDAMAKAIYGGLFQWLVERINRSTASSAPDADGPGGAGAGAKTRHAGEALAPGGTVALLDIFGFESFKVNRFEQLCINYANEKLQQKFTQDVFKNVQAEYEEEGIPWSHVDFSDNAEVLGLVESRMGIIAVLNEECVRPRGGDNSFVSKLATLHADHSAFARAKLAGPFEFSVRHYAGEVLYHAEGFLDKNRDSVGEACRDLLAKSSVPLIAKVFAPDPGSAEGDSGGGGGGSRKKSSMATNTLATKFKGSLTTLMDTIGLTSVQYVRCIKPNAAKLPGRMENAKVAEQLRCAGVVEAIRISRAAYPNRMARTDFNKRPVPVRRHRRVLGHVRLRVRSQASVAVAGPQQLLKGIELHRCGRGPVLVHPPKLGPAVPGAGRGASRDKNAASVRGEFACCGVAKHRPVLLTFLLWKREGVGSGFPLPASVESARRRTPALFPRRILKKRPRGIRMAPFRRGLASSLALSLVAFNTPPLTGPLAGRGGPLGAAAVDQKKFRKCADTGFCRRNRDLTSPPQTPFRVNPESVRSSAEGITADIWPGDGGSAPLSLRVRFYENGVCRLKVDEQSPEGAQRWEPPDVFLEHQLEAAEHTLLSPGDPSLPPALQELPEGWRGVLAAYGKLGGNVAGGGGGGGSSGRYVLSVRYEPFQADLYAGDALAVSANRRGLMHFEQTRGKDDAAAAGEGGAGGKTVDLHRGKKVKDYGEDGLAIYEDGTRETQEEHNRVLEEAEVARQGKDESGLGLWEESFDGHPDSKPDGPTSVGMDVYFPGSDHVYGIPEHAASMSLKTTTTTPTPPDEETAAPPHFSEPYRLYTLDVFEYELDSSAALYGAIPVMLGHRRGQTAGVFWFNPTETFVDVEQGGAGEGKRARWISEGGALDLVLLPGPTPGAVFKQYAEVTGKPELPPMFSLGFHQCRWNYRDEQDVLAVDAGFEERDFPYDVIWLDIEHTDGKRYFTWDKGLFPDPKRMIDKVAAHGRRMVTIVDPHIKRDGKYAVHKEATSKGLYIKDKDGNDFDGWCWPGQSSYLDFTDEGVRDWWASRFALEEYEGSTLDLYTWNDMNEPSVFNGPEVSMKKDCLSLAGIEHRHWHNTYGMYMQRATAEGLELPRRGNARRGGGGDGRPFVLSRAFFAGSQRWGAVWTGDNAAKWDHLAASAPMLLSMSLAGLPFVGADVGGFFGDPSAELFLRWMQAAAYQPFFRSHAHHDSKRREPWVYGDPWTARVRSVVMARYALLPYWYTLFQEASDTGIPMMRPMWVQYPGDANTFDMDNQWMAGADLLVKPVVTEGATVADVYLPGVAEECSGTTTTTTASLWYDVETLQAVEVRGPGEFRPIEAPVDKIPVFQRGGSIIPRKQRLRRSSLTMAGDPYTLVVALDDGGRADGNLYLDDEESYDYRDKEGGGGRTTRRFSFEGGVLKGRVVEGSGTYSPANTIERVVIVGVSAAPSSVTLHMAAAAGTALSLDFTYDALTRVVTVRKPDVCVVEDFDVTLSFAAGSTS